MAVQSADRTEASTRTERDLLGEEEIPAGAYWGIHTLRGQANFRAGEATLSDYPELIRALAEIKAAAAAANRDVGLLPPSVADAIIRACGLIINGEHHDQFPLRMIQGGAGTSTNMNANEVIANLALELNGHSLGDYSAISPTEHVNLGQSTNDVYPTALKIALIRSTHRLLKAMEHLQRAFEAKSTEFRGVVKVGRTQLQDAVPMTLGVEFEAFAVLVAEDIGRIDDTLQRLHEINLGGTAIGTGLSAHPRYSKIARDYLSRSTGLPLLTSRHLVAATQDTGAFVFLSSAIKLSAVKLSKISSDLRLLSSGPRAGLGEISLPARQAGSSIMPGKVNPVIPEMVNQIAFEILGHDVTVTAAAEAGQLQLNAFEPIIAYSMFRSIEILTTAFYALADDCVAGIRANHAALNHQVGSSLSIATALNSTIGYAAASAIAKEALLSSRSIRDVALETGLLDEATLDYLLDVNRAIGLREVAASKDEVGAA